MADVRSTGPRSERQPPALAALEQLAADLLRVSPRPEFAAGLRARLLSCAPQATAAGRAGPAGHPASAGGGGTGTGGEAAVAALTQLVARVLRWPPGRC